jgi:hypothetical protein
MLNSLANLYKVGRVCWQINKFNNTNSYYHRRARQLLTEFLQPFNLAAIPKLPHNTEDKLRWYMSETLYMGEAFNELFGRKSTPEEKDLYMYSGMLGALLDIMVDDITLSSEQLQQLKDPGLPNENNTPFERLYAAAYHLVFSSIPEEQQATVKHYFTLTYDAQVASKLQFSPQLSRAEVDKISHDKCGYGTLCLRALLPEPISEAEELAWLEIGALIQYCNDAQDLHKDLNKKLRTFASVRPHPDTIAADLDRQKVVACRLFKQTHFAKNRKDFFLLGMQIMYAGILVKLQIMSRLAGTPYSHHKLAALPKAEVRHQTQIRKLLKLSLPKVINYSYEGMDAPLIG